ncbi:MAG TPA: sulfotransferase [Rugosimonospora sp.]|nr:sulfotransferase [Rugosimonospora sp.]
MVRVVFVGGLGRSGTTLLERILGELPTVCPLGEVVHLWQRDLRDNERCGCGTAFSRCEFWQAVGEEAFGGWAQVDPARVLALREAVERTRHIPRLAAPRLPNRYRALVAEYAGYYAALYRGAATVSGADVLIDSSKNSSLAYCLRWSSDIDLRVIHMVRDSRGVAYSWTKTVTRPESPVRDEMTRYAPGRAALLWNAHNAAFGLLPRRGVPVRRVRYEALLADPTGTVRQLADFAGVPAGPLDFLHGGAVRLGPCHSAAGNPMRFTTGELPLRQDEAWRSQLPPRQRRLVGALTAPLLSAYGYGRR